MRWLYWISAYFLQSKKQIDKWGKRECTSFVNVQRKRIISTSVDGFLPSNSAAPTHLSISNKCRTTFSARGKPVESFSTSCNLLGRRRWGGPEGDVAGDGKKLPGEWIILDAFGVYTQRRSSLTHRQTRSGKAVSNNEIWIEFGGEVDESRVGGVYPCGDMADGVCLVAHWQQGLCYLIGYLHSHISIYIYLIPSIYLAYVSNVLFCVSSSSLFVNPLLWSVFFFLQD